MKRFLWPLVTASAVRLMPPDHPNIVRVVGHILDHARAGQHAFASGKLIDAKYHRDCCGWLIWRLAVDGLTQDGQVRWDGAKYETKLPGRLSSAAARSIRVAARFANKKAAALENHVRCDHVVPRNCVAEVLVRPGWWQPHDEDAGRRFILSHAEVAILSPEENERLHAARLDSKMPAVWWDAPLGEKGEFARSRYEAVDPKIDVSRWISTPAPTGTS